MPSTRTLHQVIHDLSDRPESNEVASVTMIGKDGRRASFLISSEVQPNGVPSLNIEVITSEEGGRVDLVRGHWIGKGD